MENKLARNWFKIERLWTFNKATSARWEIYRKWEEFSYPFLVHARTAVGLN